MLNFFAKKYHRYFICLVFIISLFLFPINSKGQEKLPELNKKIIEYVKTTIGTQVGRGECWDLAYEALTRHEAMWDWKYEYGRLFDPHKEDVFPGDLIQLENVVLKYKKGRVLITETMKHHTAIVFKIIDQKKKIFEIAHQNTDFSGRKVGLNEFNLNHVISGKVMFYRPVPLE